MNEGREGCLPGFRRRPFIRPGVDVYLRGCWKTNCGLPDVSDSFNRIAAERLGVEYRPKVTVIAYGEASVIGSTAISLLGEGGEAMRSLKRYALLFNCDCCVLDAAKKALL